MCSDFKGGGILSGKEKLVKDGAGVVTKFQRLLADAGNRGGLLH